LQTKKLKYEHRHTYKIDQGDALAKMKRALEGKADKQQPNNLGQSEETTKKELPKLDISLISAIGFRHHTKKKENEICLSSIHEIEKTIQAKTEWEEDNELVA